MQNERQKQLIDRRDDAQSQLDALMGEAPETAAILERRIASLDRLIDVERRGDAYYLGGGADASLEEWRTRQAQKEA